VPKRSTTTLCEMSSEFGGQEARAEKFYGRFLRSEDFLEQGYAIPRNTLQMVNHQTRRRCLPCNPHVDVFAHFCVGNQRQHNRFNSST
jgi:hypothetical protein